MSEPDRTTYASAMRRLLTFFSTPSWTASDESAFRSYRDNLQRLATEGTVVGLIGVILLTWPSDVVVFASRPEFLPSITTFRVTLIVGGLLYLALLRLSTWCAERSLPVFVFLLCVKLAIDSYVDARITGSESILFYATYVTPFVTVLFPMQLGRRLAATSLLVATILLARYVPMPELLFRPLGWVPVVFVSGTTLAAVGLGHFVYTLQRTNFLQRRQLERQTEDLQQVNRLQDSFISQAAEQLAAKERVLAQAQKMEAIGRVTSGVAHDINNVLLTIQVNKDLAADTLEDEALVADALEQIEASVERAHRLTDHMLAFSRGKRMQLTDCNLNDVLRDATQLLEVAAGSSIEVRVDQAEDLWPVLVDPVQVERILLNLVINSAESIGSIGRILIQTENVVIAGDRDSGTDGDFAQILVRDNGEGMEADIASRVFEPFFTTKSETGVGMGLSTVYGIVQQLQGDIELESTPGVGTTFRIRFPRNLPTLPTLETVPLNSQPHLGTIMLVDDEPLIVASIARLLQGKHLKVLTAEHGSDALRQLTSMDGKVDLLLTDLMMPVMGGFELAREVRARYPHMPVLLMTGYADHKPDETLDAFPLLEKPFKSDLLTERIFEHLGQPVPD